MSVTDMNSDVLPAGDSRIETSPETSLTWPSPPSPSLSGARLELFQKLGYSAQQVQKVLRQFGPALDTDKLLEKLVEVGEAEHGNARAAAAVRMNVPVTQAEMRAPGPAEEGGADDDPFRPIVIDGSNVAMSHGNKEVFSCLGIQLAVAFFRGRGHKSVTVFVPSWRSEKPRPDVPISDQHILRELERQKLLVFTPSKRVRGKRIVCHDDRYIVKLAFETDGLIVSNDLYRDLQRENPEWKLFIEERLIMFSFVNDKFMPPDDPMGRHGPSLDELRLKCPVVQKKQNCPYGRKCTFGIKCRFLHPDRPKQSNQSLADELRSRCPLAPPPGPAPGHSLSLVEDMAKHLTLKKDHASETSWTSHGTNSLGSKSVPGKKSSRRERKARHVSLESASVTSGDSHELDSGLGSIDGVHVYAQPHSAPQRPPYSQPPDVQRSVHRPPQQMYWSDPCAAPPGALCGDNPRWEPGRASAGHAHNPREEVRKKLRAIFSAQLVDAAMSLNPQLLDAQRLATEIVRLQSQGL
ncbi:endoribonuclease ZC3H12A [Eucyclogobius newberryi]|uniref:endoribonuclease ZC3H12A n=1 Tax=Eucyclogobius newberryi TaxID=166745 RepID=UPI003B58BE08